MATHRIKPLAESNTTKEGEAPLTSGSHPTHLSQPTSDPRSPTLSPNIPPENFNQ